MKKHLTGIIALMVAFCAFAFTNVPGVKKGSPTSKYTDPCADNSKMWFMITLECGSQGSISDIRNPLNYTASNPTQVNLACQGSECVCAIRACPTMVAGAYRPNISSTTYIYEALYEYYQVGTSSPDIKEKDEQGNQRKSQ